MRAISRFASFSRALFSSAPVADWKRRLNSSCRRSCNAFSNSSSVMSLMSLALKEIRLPLHELRLHRELRAGKSERFLCERLRYACELEHHATRLDDGDPVLGRALARAHARLGRLLGRRLVREDVDPDLPAALDLARHRDAGGLDLAVGDPGRLERLQAVVAELHGRLTLREPATPAALVLAVFHFLREEHYSSAFSCFVGSSVCCFGVVVSGASATGAGVVSTCLSTGGCSRPSADFACSSVRGRSTFSWLRARSRGAPPPPPRLWPPRPPWPPRPRRDGRTGPRPSRSRCRSRPLSREAPRPSTFARRRRAWSCSPSRTSFSVSRPPYPSGMISPLLIQTF